MNKIVREHYPVAKLPDDLQEGFLPTDDVVVTVERATHGGTRRFAEFWSARKDNFTTDEAVVNHLRSGRDDGR